MKKILSVIFCFVLLLSVNSVVYADNEITVKLDGKTLEFDVQPQLIGGRTMVPVRKIFEELGMVVEWFEETQTVMAAKRGVVVDFPIGSTTVSRNTVEQTIDVPAQLIGERTLVPVRFVSEFAGAEVVWDGTTNTVFINSTDNIQHLAWNDTYEYWGEVENGQASGYGALYKKEDGSLRQIGKYINSEIVTGTDFFEDGDTFKGDYKNGNRTYGTYYYSNGDYFSGKFKNEEISNGTYYYSASGDSYTGDFVNYKKHGKGTYYYADKSFLTGNWVDGKIDGYCVLYDSVEDVQASGVVVNGKRDGYFVFEDFALDYTYYATYVDGEVIYSSETPYDSTEIYEAYKQNKINETQRQEELAQIEKDIDDLYEAYQDLDERTTAAYEELYDYIKNGNPYSTDWAQTIYANYGIGNTNSYVNGTGSNGGNIDSFAAANAMKQNAALKAKADAAILEYNNTYIANWKKTIEDQYNSEKASLDRMKETLLKRLEQLEKQ